MSKDDFRRIITAMGKLDPKVQYGISLGLAVKLESNDSNVEEEQENGKHEDHGRFTQVAE